MWSLWRDLNANCCDEKGCNFANTTVRACNTMVCILHQHNKTLIYQVSFLPDFYTSAFVIQVNLAFQIVYDIGLNEYALYLDCAGGVKSHKGYERSMQNLFQSYREHWKNLKVIFIYFLVLIISHLGYLLIQITEQYYRDRPCKHHPMKSFQGPTVTHNF